MQKHNEELLIAKAEAITTWARLNGIMTEEQKSVIEIGSKLYGISFKLFLENENGDMEKHPLYNNGFLGMTKKEASETLSVILDVLYSFAGFLRKNI